MQQIGAYILAGGKSSRMGREKGLVELNGQQFIDHIKKAVRAAELEPVIISNSDLYNGGDAKVIRDIIPSQGPFSGIHAGLVMNPNPYSLFLSCDIPFVSAELLRHLVAQIDNHSEIIIVSVNGKTEPLCGIYKKTCATKIAKRLSEGKRSVRDALLVFKTKIVEISKCDFYSEKLMFNINTSEELETAKKYLA